MKLTVVCGINDWSAKDGKEPIYIKINEGEKRRWVKVGVRILKTQWDEKNSRVKAHPNMADINLKIIAMLAEIERNYINDEIADTGDKKDFYYWFQQRLDYTEKKHGVYNLKHLTTVFNSLKEFSPTLSVKNINSSFIKNYELFLIEKGNPSNTIADRMMRV